MTEGAEPTPLTAAQAAEMALKFPSPMWLPMMADRNVFICTGHGGHERAVISPVNRSVPVPPGMHIHEFFIGRELAPELRCPVCGRNERLGNRRMRLLLDAVAAGRIEQVDISLLHR